MPEKDRRGDEGPPPKAAGFLQKSRQPFQAVFQKPGMGALHVPRVKIKNSAHGADELHIQFVLVPMDPLFLFGRRHPHPEYVRLSPVDRRDHRPVLFLAEDFLEQR